MTREEAIYEIKQLAVLSNKKNIDHITEALEMAIEALADRKTENSSEKPNNCEHITEDGVTCAKYPACDDCLDNPLSKVKGSERLVKGSEQTEPTISKMEQVDKDINVRSKNEPKTQMKTQNSNLTFEKDECAKEYEELGLKELKELIKADHKDEPQTDGKCKDCKWWNKSYGCHWKEGVCHYVPKAIIPKQCVSCDSASRIIEAYSRGFEDGANTMRQTFVADGIVFAKMGEPQTDCAWK